MGGTLLAVQFTDTITLGAALIAAMIGLLGLYRVYQGAGLRSANFIQQRTIEAMQAEAQERDNKISSQLERLSELGAEKDAAQAAVAACQATIDALQQQIDAAPKYSDVIEYGANQMKHVDEQAARRQEQFMTVVTDELKAHDERVARMHAESEQRTIQRHEEQTKFNSELLRALRDLKGGRG